MEKITTKGKEPQKPRVDKDKAAIIEKHLADRVLVESSEFEKEGDQKKLISGGIKVRRKIDSFPHMLKMIAKSSEVPNRNKGFQGMTLVNEYVVAPLYKRFLYDRVPIIAEVEYDDNVCFRSKFLHDFQTLSQFTGGKEVCGFGSDIAKLSKIEGVEKVFASMLALGEYDIHVGNIGVMKVIEDGKEKDVLAKVDHGWSATEFFTDPDKMLENFANAYKGYGYLDKLPLDIGKLKDALDQIAKISDEEIEIFVKAQTYKLKRQGLDIRGIEFNFWQNDTKHIYYGDGGAQSEYFKTKKFENFKKLERHYIENFKKQMSVIRGVIIKLNRIIKSKNLGITEMDKKSGKWLEKISKIYGPLPQQSLKPKAQQPKKALPKKNPDLATPYYLRGRVSKYHVNQRRPQRGI